MCEKLDFSYGQKEANEKVGSKEKWSDSHSQYNT